MAVVWSPPESIALRSLEHLASVSLLILSPRFPRQVFGDHLAYRRSRQAQPTGGGEAVALDQNEDLGQEGGLQLVDEFVIEAGGFAAARRNAFADPAAHESR